MGGSARESASRNILTEGSKGVGWGGGSNPISRINFSKIQASRI